MEILKYRKYGNGMSYEELYKLDKDSIKAILMEGSQCGEDGIIEEVLKRLNISSGWVCEFGAIDGKQISNAFQLVKRGFKAVMIEPLRPAFEGLLETAKEYPNIIPLWRVVEHREHFPNHLDQILKETKIPIDFDVLSIDVDSYDYQIWESLKDYNPKFVIIETNPYAKGEYIYDSYYESGFNVKNKLVKEKASSSFLSILKLGRKKGYTYFGMLSGNTFWIRNDLAPKLGNLLMSEEEVNKQIEGYK